MIPNIIPIVEFIFRIKHNIEIDLKNFENCVKMIERESYSKFLCIDLRKYSNHEIYNSTVRWGVGSGMISLEEGVVFNRRIRKSSEAPWPPRNPQTGVGASRAFNNPAYIWWTSNREVVAVPLNGAEPSTPSVGSHVHGRARAHARRARAHAAYTRTRRSTYTQTHSETWHRVKPRERGLRRRYAL